MVDGIPAVSRSPEGLCLSCQFHFMFMRSRVSTGRNELLERGRAGR